MTTGRKMNVLVRFERPEPDLDDTLQRRWLPLTSAWVAMRQRDARETLTAGQVEARAEQVLVTHWSPAAAQLRPTDRVVLPDSGRVLEITGVEDPQALHRELHVYCREVVR